MMIGYPLSPRLSDSDPEDTLHESHEFLNTPYTSQRTPYNQPSYMMSPQYHPSIPGLSMPNPVQQTPAFYLPSNSGPNPPQQTVVSGDLHTVLGVFPVDDILRRDVAMVEGQKKQLDTLLTFAGLLSAALTAFMIEVYPMLLPGPNADTSVAILVQISAQLASFSASGFYINSTQPPLSLSKAASTETPAPWQIMINLLWSTSLILSFSAASVAILVKQWLDQYGIGLTDESDHSKLLRLRRYKGFISFKIDWIIMLVPLMLQVSLLLFFAGLLQLLWTLNPIVAILGSTLIAVLFSFLVFTTILPSFVNNCPFRSPQSHIFLQVVEKIKSMLNLLAPTSNLLPPQQYLLYSTGSPYINQIVTAGSHYAWEEEEKSYLSGPSNKDAAMIIDRMLDSTVKSSHAVMHLGNLLRDLRDPAQAIHCFLPLARKYATLSRTLPSITELAMDTIRRIAFHNLEADLTYHEPLQRALVFVRHNMIFLVPSKVLPLVEDAAKIACSESPAAPFAFDVAVDLLESLDIVVTRPYGLQNLWMSLVASLERLTPSPGKFQSDYTVLLLHRLARGLEHLRKMDETQDAIELSKFWIAQMPHVLRGLHELYTRFGSHPLHLRIPKCFNFKHTNFTEKISIAMKQLALGEDWPAFCRLPVVPEVPQVRVARSVVHLLAAFHRSHVIRELEGWHMLIRDATKFVSDVYATTGIQPDIHLMSLLNSFLTPPRSASDHDTSRSAKGEPQAEAPSPPFTPVIPPPPPPDHDSTSVEGELEALSPPFAPAVPPLVEFAPRSMAHDTADSDEGWHWPGHPSLVPDIGNNTSSSVEGTISPTQHLQTGPRRRRGRNLGRDPSTPVGSSSAADVHTPAGSNISMYMAQPRGREPSSNLKSPSLGLSETRGELSSPPAAAQASASSPQIPVGTPQLSMPQLSPNEDPVHRTQPSLVSYTNPGSLPHQPQTEEGSAISIGILPPSPSRTGSPVSPRNDPDDGNHSPTHIETWGTRENDSPLGGQIYPRPSRENDHWTPPLLSTESPVAQDHDLTPPPLTHADTDFSEGGQNPSQVSLSLEFREAFMNPWQDEPTGTM